MIPRVAFVLLLVTIMRILFDDARADVTEELTSQQSRRYHKKSLCNTFGGCGEARSLPANVKGFSTHQGRGKSYDQRRQPPYMGSFQSSARAATVVGGAGKATVPAVAQDQMQSGVEIPLHALPPRVGKYVQDQASGYDPGFKQTRSRSFHVRV